MRPEEGDEKILEAERRAELEPVRPLPCRQIPRRRLPKLDSDSRRHHDEIQIQPFVAVVTLFSGDDENNGRGRDRRDNRVDFAKPLGFGCARRFKDQPGQ